MNRWKKLLHKLLFPGPAVTLLGIPVSAALLVYAFAFARGSDPLVYLSYILSFYTLVIVCAQVPRLVRGVSARLHQRPWIHRYLSDPPFRMQVSLHLSLGFNLLYAVWKFFLGAWYRSVWFGTFGVYYALLTVMRFLLLRHLNRSAFGRELASEWRRYRLCGAILLPMTLALSGVVVLVVEKNETFQYPGYLIYVVALYAFYAVIAAAVHLVKYRKYQSPVIMASKVVGLASALVSLLSLETAMLTQFGGSGETAFRQIMVASTGAGVCAITLGTAVFMILRANRQLDQLRQNTESGRS